MLSDCLAKHPPDLLECTKLSNSNFITNSTFIISRVILDKGQGPHQTNTKNEKKGARPSP